LMKMRGTEEECPGCKAENEESRANGLAKGVNEQDRRIKVLERQLEGIEGRDKDGIMLCLSCRKPVPEGKALVVKHGVVHEKCEEIFRRRTQAKAPCPTCEGSGRCPQCKGTGSVHFDEIVAQRMSGR